uniref:Uncharacterized protein n=1 Tax=Megaselia scalaris TaxID=36166 RepID=T1GKF0_MEGSC
MINLLYESQWQSTVTKPNYDISSVLLEISHMAAIIGSNVETKNMTKNHGAGTANRTAEEIRKIMLIIRSAIPMDSDPVFRS